MYVIVEKWALTVILVLWWLLMPQIGCHTDGSCVTNGCNVYSHALYMISHANVWHLAGNLFVLWMMRGELYLTEAIIIAFLVTFVPVMPGVWELTGHKDDAVTMGLSGVLFAIIGIKWGVYCARSWLKDNSEGRKAVKDFCLKVLPFALAGALIPHVNWSIHLYCLLAGLVLGSTNMYLGYRE